MKKKIKSKESSRTSVIGYLDVIRVCGETLKAVWGLIPRNCSANWSKRIPWNSANGPTHTHTQTNFTTYIRKAKWIHFPRQPFRQTFRIYPDFTKLETMVKNYWLNIWIQWQYDVFTEVMSFYVEITRYGLFFLSILPYSVLHQTSNNSVQRLATFLDTEFGQLLRVTYATRISTVFRVEERGKIKSVKKKMLWNYVCIG